MNNASRLKNEVPRLALRILLVLVLMSFATSCSKHSTSQNSNTAAGSANSANSNQADPAQAPLVHSQQNVQGNIARIQLAIQMARDAFKTNKWQDAVTFLQSAKTEVDAAIARNTRINDDFEALKAAIDRTIPLLENHSKEADARLTELQTRIGAIKVNIG